MKETKEVMINERSKEEEEEVDESYVWQQKMRMNMLYVLYMYESFCLEIL